MVAKPFEPGKPRGIPVDVHGEHDRMLVPPAAHAKGQPGLVRQNHAAGTG